MKRGARVVQERVARLRRRAREGPAARWRAYLAEVEPRLTETARVHRFAAVPLIGESAVEALPIAVWVQEAPDLPSERGASFTGAAGVLSGSLREALSGTRADRVLLLRPGDRLAPAALARLGQAATLAPDATLITCDEDRLSAGRRTSPSFRPAPSPDRWLACDDSGGALLIAREAALAALDLIAEGRPGWRHELALELCGQDARHTAHVPLLLVHRGGGALDAPLAAGRVQRLVQRAEPTASVESAAASRRVRRPLAVEPTVEVVICFRDRPELLNRCLHSLLMRTRYERFVVALVDNGSIQTATRDLLREHRDDPRVRILQDPRPFNFAALNNLAARSSRADFLVFLNNDTEIVDEDWLTTLLEEAARPVVGAVAPLLVYPSGSVQHAGVVLGMHDYAGHPFAGLAPDQPTPFGVAAGGTRNWMAVTAACLLVERSKFEAVGGFDESFVVAGNDVDLCLRLTAAGYRSLCVPHAVVVHDESRSRGAHIDPADFVRSEVSYGEFRTVGDPFYNPSLTLRRTDCGVRSSLEER